ncbi:MAG: hypothetical protein IJP31_09135 [Lachnospiraceae bacterium]|nr:hypothetical protein [Lachnospiraceae bacterium]
MNFSAVNTIWVLVGAAMVFFMQAGFAMVETGFTRAKNAGNIIMKNLMDFCIGTPAFWLVGFGLMFGGTGSFIGSLSGIAEEANYGTAMLPEGVSFYTYLIFQTVFCATSATIVSGAMAERTKFSSYCLYSLIISLVIYPISGHWIWGGGWLARLGFHDFAGSTAVHLVSGVAAFIGAAILGPRIGKYDQDGKAKAIPGHSLTLGALGVFILWFCWFGFNGASTVSMEGESIITAGKIFVNTNLAATIASCTVLIITWIKYRKPDISMTLVFLAIKHTIGLRVSAEEEIVGLDIMEHGIESSYADFIPTVPASSYNDIHECELMGGANQAPAEHAPAAALSKVETSSQPAEFSEKAGFGEGYEREMSKISIITRQNKLDELMQALNSIGVTGITITNVLGCGMQKGAAHYYRGAKMDMNLLPKIKVEIVVSKVPVDAVIETARKVLYTGKIGDGKLFIYNIENVVKIRTGEQGYAALQDTVE